MAVKVIETKNGEVTKTSKQLKTEKVIRRFQKYVSITAALMVMFIVSAINVFAGTDNSIPDGVKTDTMSSMGTIIWWVVRVAILAIGGIPAVIKIVQGQADENARDRNAGIATLIITAAAFGATFALQAVIGI